MLPPVEKSFEFLLVKKEVGDNKIMLYLPTGDSYYMKPGDVKKYLELMDFEDWDHCIDYVWNFHTVVIDLRGQRYFWVGQDCFREAISKTQLVGAEL